MDLVHEQRLTEVEQLAKSNEHRIKDIEKRQDDLTDLVSTVKVLAVREENVESDVKEIKSDVKSLTNKPAQKWDNLIEKVFMMVVSAIVGAILVQIGLG